MYKILHYDHSNESYWATFIGKLSITQCRVKAFLTFESVDKTQNETTQVKATEQYFPVVLFIMLYKVVLTFESVDEILKCDHSK